MHVQRFPNVEKLHNKLIHGKLDRRQFLGTAALAGVGTIGAGHLPAHAQEQINYFT